MFRVKVKFGKVWKLGKVEYASYDEADHRVKELKSLRKGVQAKVVDGLGGEL